MSSSPHANSSRRKNLILLNPIGSGGDVLPFLEIGKELLRRRHRVAVITNPFYSKQVKEAGLEFNRSDSKQDLLKAGKAMNLAQGAAGWKVALKWGAVGTMRQTFKVINSRVQNSIQDNVAVVTNHLGFGARIAAEKLNLPSMTILPSPFALRSCYESSVTPPIILSRWMPRLCKSFQFWLADRFVIDPLLSEVNDFRDELGLSRTNRLMQQFLDHQKTICLFPEWFAPRQPDWNQDVCFAGNYASVQVNEELDPDIQTFISRKKTIVLLGGSRSPGAEFYEMWVDVVQRLDRQLLILEPNEDSVPKGLPSIAKRAKFVPLATVLGSCEALIHSGGIGATLQAIENGTPQLVIPRVNDQFDNAARVVRLQLGLQLCSRSPKESARCLVKLLNDSQMRERCALKQNEIKNDTSDSLNRACEIIEREIAGG